MNTIYILGGGAVGLPLAAFLAHAGRPVLAVRTSRDDVPRSCITVNIDNGERQVRATVETISLAQLDHLDGTLVVTSKAHANPAIAQALARKAATGPVVILQNGLSVERPFLQAKFPSVYRCVLYVTAQARAGNDFLFRPVTASPIGTLQGNDAECGQCIADVNTDFFPFRSEPNIQRETWKKAIINAVFNSICPLLDIDNGIFVRNAAVAALAREVIAECITLTDRLNLGLTEAELVDQLNRISTRSDGQLISTLQDIRNGRQTEIEFLNLEIARIAAALQPALSVPKTALLGQMTLAKSLLIAPQQRLGDFLTNSPLDNSNLVIERDTSASLRDIDL